MKVFVHAGKLNKAEISGQANLVTTRSSEFAIVLDSACHSGFFVFVLITSLAIY
jgi:hypothetical protein